MCPNSHGPQFSKVSVAPIVVAVGVVAMDAKTAVHVLFPEKLVQQPESRSPALPNKLAPNLQLQLWLIHIQLQHAEILRPASVEHTVCRVVLRALFGYNSLCIES